MGPDSILGTDSIDLKLFSYSFIRNIAVWLNTRSIHMTLHIIEMKIGKSQRTMQYTYTNIKSIMVCWNTWNNHWRNVGNTNSCLFLDFRKHYLSEKLALHIRSTLLNRSCILDKCFIRGDSIISNATLSHLYFLS